MSKASEYLSRKRPSFECYGRVWATVNDIGGVDILDGSDDDTVSLDAKDTMRFITWLKETFED